MPELPDITVYVERLAALLVGRRLTGIRLSSPFLVRTVDPPLAACTGAEVVGVERLGKRIVIGMTRPEEPEFYLVIHLMIAGRLRWKAAGAKHTAPNVMAVFDVEDVPGRASGCIVFTEASKKRRASIHVVRGRAALAEHDRGGVEVLGLPLAAFLAQLRSERHTLKRSLTDPRLFSGIGNAYSDEILHAAKLSPVAQSTALDDDDGARLHQAVQDVLNRFTEALRAEVGDGFPDTVTAFRDDMAVHGRYGKPCPVCNDPVQRIVYADNETNYCATCQTDGRLLADRALSRLLKSDWPRSLDELEQLKRR